MKGYTRELTDTALHEEIELIADLVVAASDSAGRLSDVQIDEALGLSRCHRWSA